MTFSPYFDPKAEKVYSLKKLWFIGIPFQNLIYHGTVYSFCLLSFFRSPPFNSYLKIGTIGYFCTFFRVLNVNALEILEECLYLKTYEKTLRKGP